MSLLRRHSVIGAAREQIAGVFSKIDESYLTSSHAVPELTFGNSGTDSAFTVLAWVYIEDTGSTVKIITNANQATNEKWSLLQLAENHATLPNHIRFLLYSTTGADYIGIDSNVSISRNTWHLIAATYNGSKANTGIELYVDGTIVSTPTRLSNGTYAGLLDATENDRLQIGGSLLASQYMDGQIDDIGVYDRVLTLSEILSIYEGDRKLNYKQHSATKDNLVLYVDFQNEFADISSTGVHFANINKVTFSNSFDKGYLRVAAFNVYAKFDSGYVTDDSKAIVKHLLRVDADIVVLSEVNDIGYSGVVNDEIKLYTPYKYVARGKTGIAGNCIISKYPISNVQVLDSTYINAPGGGDEMSSVICPLRAEVTIGTDVLVVYGVHFEPWCMTGPCANEERPTLEFPRAIQAYRTYQDYLAHKASNPTYKYIMIGDFNEDDASPQTDSFASEPVGIRGDFVLGSDIAFPFNYSQFPDDHLSGFTVLKGTDLQGERYTINIDANPAFVVPVRLDYICIESGITHLGNEILFSDHDVNSGRTKIGNPLPTGLSETASDHRLIFADIQL